MLSICRWGAKSELLGTIESVLYDAVDYTQHETDLVDAD